MKTHLLRPLDKVTMCGRELKHFSTTNPAWVDCAKCRWIYNFKQEWYWLKLSTTGHCVVRRRDEFLDTIEQMLGVELSDWQRHYLLQMYNREEGRIEFRHTLSTPRTR